ncbi:hypothetical protein Pelo_483 [Pelomyxa schiedti]|nr:hypothetical protein Pelo_483 [Pelomyxa schiedti]
MFAVWPRGNRDGVLAQIPLDGHASLKWVQVFPDSVEGGNVALVLSLNHASGRSTLTWVDLSSTYAAHRANDLLTVQIPTGIRLLPMVLASKNNRPILASVAHGAIDNQDHHELLEVRSVQDHLLANGNRLLADRVRVCHGWPCCITETMFFENPGVLGGPISVFTTADLQRPIATILTQESPVRNACGSNGILAYCDAGCVNICDGATGTLLLRLVGPETKPLPPPRLALRMVPTTL